VLGLVREVLMAVIFGTSLAKSAFDVAFRIPNLFRRLFGEGALSAAFVPVFTEAREKEGPAAANQLFGRIGTLLAAVLLIIVGLGVLVLLGLEKTWSLGPKASAVIPLLRVMLPYVFFICLVALSMGALNSLGHFAVPAFTPILLNLVWIASLLWICPRFGASPDEQIFGLALGILAAGALQLLVQIPVLMKFGIRPSLSFRLNDARVRRVLMLVGPAALGVGVHQVNVVIDGILALWVGDWAPAALTYAERMIYLPLGIIATALGTVLLPAFSKQVAREDVPEMIATLGASLKNILMIMLPATVGLIVLARPIVRLVFNWEGGLFDESSELYTSRAMVFYAGGLVVFSLYKVIVPAFYANQDMRTPVRIGLYTVALNLVLNIIFILTWPEGYQHAGLALATVISSAVNCAVLGRLLHLRYGNPGWTDILKSFGAAAVGSLIMGFVVLFCLGSVQKGFAGAALNAKWVQAASVGVSIFAGMAIYGLWLFVISRDTMKTLIRRGR
jgi:putative peptidoglycan lipid II flippase